MAIIKVLDEHIANQIAAGEVVERPSSIVKELVENSIDAGATRIDVSVEEGGLQFIRVKDNGSGIGDDDVEKAFLRHATSKIHTGKDLFSIRSLGFRGEALPSIAAVAKVELVTATAANGLGWRFVIEGGKIDASEPAQSMPGTEVTVRELFYNTPARLKYMKTTQTELGHISNLMYRLALAYPTISFMLKHNDHTLLQTTGDDNLQQVIASVYGFQTAKEMLAVKAEQLDFEIEGYIGKPELTRSNRNAMSWIINGRYVRSLPLSQAALKAYYTFLPINRYPLLVLHVRMHPSLVDVNVHPAKLEVRFSKETALYPFIEGTISDLLHQQRLIPQVRPEKVKVRTHVEQVEMQWEATKAVAASQGTPSLPLTLKPPKPLKALVVKPESFAEIERRKADGLAVNERWIKYAEKRNKQPSSSAETKVAKNISKGRQTTEEEIINSTMLKFPVLCYIGQLHGTYLIASNEEGMYVVDQHAAHERINYEYYYERFGNAIAASQQLLLPITLEFTPADAERIHGQMYLLEQVGVVMESFGGQTFLVRSHPYWFPQGSEAEIIQNMVDWVLNEKDLDISRLRVASATMCACKASIKANQRLTSAEAEMLFVTLGTCRQPFTCPHGRPIIIHLTTYDLERMFKRVM